MLSPSVDGHVTRSKGAGDFRTHRHLNIFSPAYPESPQQPPVHPLPEHKVIRTQPHLLLTLAQTAFVLFSSDPVVRKKRRTTQQPLQLPKMFLSTGFLPPGPLYPLSYFPAQLKPKVPFTPFLPLQQSPFWDKNMEAKR